MNGKARGFESSLVAGLEVQYLGLEPAPIWDADATGRGLDYYALALAKVSHLTVTFFILKMVLSLQTLYSLSLQRGCEVSYGRLKSRYILRHHQGCVAKCYGGRSYFRHLSLHQALL